MPRHGLGRGPPALVFDLDLGGGPPALVFDWGINS